MEENASSSGGGGKPTSRFSETHWTVVYEAGAGSASHNRDAFGRLYKAYQSPLRTYLHYNRYSKQDLEDLLQGFFAHLLASNGLEKVEKKGRFRSWLLSSLKNFIVNEWRKEQALKRGGGNIYIPIGPLADDGEIDPQDGELKPDLAYDRKWAITLLNRVLERLSMEYSENGKAMLFEELKGYLSGRSGESGYGPLGDRLGIKANTVAVAVKRLRERYAELLRAELADTVDPDMIDDEWRYLQMAIAGR